MRATLGRHAYATASSEAIYSRDLAVGPVRRFAEVIRQIAARKFLPDSLRSGYFPFPPSPPTQAGPSEQQSMACAQEVAVKDEGTVEDQHHGGPVLIEESSEAEGSDSTSASCGEVSGEETEPPSKRGRVGDAHCELAWFMHRGSKKLHVLRGQMEKPLFDRVLACGRALSDSCTRADSGMLQGDKCVMCARSLSEP